MTQPVMAPSSTDVDRSTGLEPVPSARRGSAVVPDQGRSAPTGVRGGCRCALRVRAAHLLAPDRPVRTLSTSSVRTGALGPATLALHEVRRGRSSTTTTTGLTQDGRPLRTRRSTALGERAGVQPASTRRTATD